MPTIVIDSTFPTPTIGASCRCLRPGPEQDLVDWFLDAQVFTAPSGYCLTVFREPRLESGFPDLVLVVWRWEATRFWRPIRAELSSYELRTAHYVRQRPHCNYAHLRSVFVRNTCAALERLEAADLLYRVNDCWMAQALSQSFAAHRIIAIEAKVSEWERVLSQALLNTWFASHSYVLVPKIPRSSSRVDAALSRGIGVVARSEPSPHEPLHSGQPLPRSYASWLFNEWAWRATILEKESSLYEFPE